jgi:hypothetical protein
MWLVLHDLGRYKCPLAVGRQVPRDEEVDEEEEKVPMEAHEPDALASGSLFSNAISLQ